jgi:hypothetical protein
MLAPAVKCFELMECRSPDEINSKRTRGICIDAADSSVELNPEHGLQVG